jgi:hypothetical protein
MGSECGHLCSYGGRCVPRPELVVSTAHKAKGLEWPPVRVVGDFWELTDIWPAWDVLAHQLETSLMPSVASRLGQSVRSYGVWFYRGAVRRPGRRSSGRSCRPRRWVAPSVQYRAQAWP